jgi:hypothetical protein
LRRDVTTAARALVLPTLLLLFTVGVVPGRLPLVIRFYALGVCAVVLWLGLLALRRAYPHATPLRRKDGRGSRERRIPPTLARIEDELALGVAGAFDLHHRVVPRLRAVASGLLSSRRRVSLDRDPEEACRILGDETWEIVRPDRQPPEDRLARGISPDGLARVVDSLEAV